MQSTVDVAWEDRNTNYPAFLVLNANYKIETYEQRHIQLCCLAGMAIGKSAICDSNCWATVAC